LAGVIAIFNRRSSLAETYSLPAMRVFSNVSFLGSQDERLARLGALAERNFFYASTSTSCAATAAT